MPLGRHGFTLVELLVVMGIIVVLLVMAVPAFNAIKGGNDFVGAAYDVAGVMEQARTYAMSNHSYVFVGLAEVDAAKSDSENPQTAASASAGGRLVVMAFVSKDGTRGYNVNNPTDSWKNLYDRADDGVTAKPAGFRLTPITKLLRYENVHLAALETSASGGMQRPTPATGTNTDYVVADAACASVTPISYPLGSALNAGKYSFVKVIIFDPQGVARIQFAANGDAIDRFIEIGLQPSHGNAVPTPTNVGQQAAVQVDCVTGAVRIYQP